MSSLTFLRMGLRSEQVGRARGIGLGAQVLMAVIGLYMGIEAGMRQADLHSTPAAVWGMVMALSLAAHYQGRTKSTLRPEERDFLVSIRLRPITVAHLKLMQQMGGSGWITAAGPAALVTWVLRTPAVHGWLAVLLWPALHLAMGQLVQGVYVWVEDSAARTWWHRLLKLSLALFGVLGMLGVYGAFLAPGAAAQVGGLFAVLGGTYVQGALTGAGAGAVALSLLQACMPLVAFWGMGIAAAVRGYAHVLRVENSEQHLHRRLIAPPRGLERERSPFAAHLQKNIVLLTRTGGPLLGGLLMTSLFLIGLLWFFTRGLHGTAASPIWLRVSAATMLGLFTYMLTGSTGPGLMRQDIGWIGLIRAAGQLPTYIAAQVVSSLLLTLPTLAVVGTLASWVLGVPALPLLGWGLEAAGLMVPVSIWAYALTLRLGSDPSQPSMMSQLPGLLALYPVLMFSAVGAALGWWVLTLVVGPMAVLLGLFALGHSQKILRGTDLP